MMLDILITNQGNITASLTTLCTHLEQLRSALAVGDFELVQSLLAYGAQKYDEIIPKRNFD